jgi:hypothetical protein
MFKKLLFALSLAAAGFASQFAPASASPLIGPAVLVDAADASIQNVQFYGPPPGYGRPHYGPPRGYGRRYYGPPRGYGRGYYSPPPGYGRPAYGGYDYRAPRYAPAPGTVIRRPHYTPEYQRDRSNYER